MPTIIPIITYGSSRPITEHEAKVIVGCMIILSVIWLITSCYFVAKYYKENKHFYGFWEFYFFDNNVIFFAFNTFMVFIYGLVILLWMGNIVAQYI